MKKIPFLFLSILLFVGCSDHKESPMTNETLKTALAETWIFPTNSAFDRLEIDEKGEYELFEKKVGRSVNSFNGEYQIEEGLKVVTLNHFGYFEIKSLTSNSVCIILYNEAAQTKEEVTLTAKVPEKLLPNKEKHLSKIVLPIYSIPKISRTSSIRAINCIDMHGLIRAKDQCSP